MLQLHPIPADVTTAGSDTISTDNVTTSSGKQTVPSLGSSSSGTVTGAAAAVSGALSTFASNHGLNVDHISNNIAKHVAELRNMPPSSEEISKYVPHAGLLGLGSAILAAVGVRELVNQYNIELELQEKIDINVRSTREIMSKDSKLRLNREDANTTIKLSERDGDNVEKNKKFPGKQDKVKIKIKPKTRSFNADEIDVSD